MYEQEEDETLDEFYQRRFAMKRSVRELIKSQNHKTNGIVSTFKTTLPFRVDPASIIMCFLGSKDNGVRFVHIDLTGTWHHCTVSRELKIF